MAYEKELRRFDSTLEVWLAALDSYDDAAWRRAPADDVWSIGQVYAHLVDAGTSFGIDKIEKCFERRGEKSKKTFAGYLVFLIGRIPPVRVKAPFKGYAPQLREKSEARAALLEVKRRLHEVAPRIADAGGTAGHPFLGKLNAREWLIFSEMHLRHHLRQKKRIDALLAQSPETSR